MERLRRCTNRRAVQLGALIVSSLTDITAARTEGSGIVKSRAGASTACWVILVGVGMARPSPHSVEQPQPGLIHDE